MNKIIDFELVKLLKEYRKTVTKQNKTFKDFHLIRLAEPKLYNSGLISKYELSSRSKRLLNYYEQFYKTNGLKVARSLKL